MGLATIAGIGTLFALRSVSEWPMIPNGAGYQIETFAFCYIKKSEWPMIPNGAGYTDNGATRTSIGMSEWPMIPNGAGYMYIPEIQQPK